MQTYGLFSETDLFESPQPGTPMETESSDESKPTIFSTDIDTLMRTIQDKSGVTSQPAEEVQGEPEVGSSKRPRKRYVCEVPGCGKSFYQKTHLDIHTVCGMRLPPCHHYGSPGIAIIPANSLHHSAPTPAASPSSAAHPTAAKNLAS